MGDPVSRRSDNTKSDRVVPIVFVPGVMGTRLEFPKDRVSWDPDAPFYMYRNWYKKPPEVKAAILDSENPAKIIEEDVGLGWGTVAKNFYRAFLTYLHGIKFRNALCRVYAVGYDWRQSCSDSGDYVAVKIERAMELERAKAAIVVTHSMGGLVTRAALKQNPMLAGKLLGAIHVVQPVAGSPMLYRRFFTGMIKDWDAGGSEVFADILGTTPYAFVLMLSGLPGAFELLPTHQYRYIPEDVSDTDQDLKVLHAPWESSERGNRDDKGRMVYPFGIARGRFLSTDSPPGLFNPKLHGSKNKKATAKTKKKVEGNIVAGDQFHQHLKLTMHPNTWAIYGTGLETDVAVRYPMKKPQEMAYRRDRGDGTVPDASGGGLFASSVEASAKNAKTRTNRQFFVKKAEHGIVFDNEAVRATIVQIINLILKT